MTDSPTAGGAASRLASVDLMFAIEEMRVAILQLSIAMRVHRTEVEQSTKARMDPQDIRLAWRQANAMTAEALTQLSAAFERVQRRRRSILAAVDAADPAMIALRTT